MRRFLIGPVKRPHRTLFDPGRMLRVGFACHISPKPASSDWFQEPRASAFKNARNLRRQSRSALQCRLSPIRKGLPIDIALDGVAKEIRWH